MSESNTDELEQIREQRRAELEARATGEPSTEEPTTPDEPVYVNGAENLNDVVSTHDVVLVDFYADWCGPCKMLEPIVADVAAETEALVAKVDVDQNQSLAGQYGVRGVPTMILFAGGEPAERIVGVRDKSSLAGLIQQHATA